MASLKDRMNFAPLKPSAERKLDAYELIQYVLPSCQIRPYVYNQIARLAKEVQNEADELAQAEAREEGEEYFPLKRNCFVMHISENIRHYTIEDRKLDVALLTDLVTLKRRAYVAVKLNRGKYVLENEIKAMERAQKQAARDSVKERSLMLQTYTSVLPHLRDRPNLYSQVCAHISMLVEGDAAAQKRIVPAKIPVEAGEPEISSHEQWLDVQRLDELIDVMIEGSFVKAAFETMKMSAVADAKATQQKEAERIARTRFRRIDSLENETLSQ